MPIDRNSAQYITGAIYKPTQTSAPGVWDLDDQANNLSKNLWPLPPQAVQRSLRFNSADSTSLTRTPSSAGNRQTYTFSAWIKRSAIGVQQFLFDGRSTSSTDPHSWFQFTSADILEIAGYSTVLDYQLITTQVFRDPCAWYNLVVAFDTTQVTSSNRIKVYINGTQITTFSTASYPSQNFNTYCNSAQLHTLGAANAQTAFSNCYLAEVNFVDGQQLTPSSFGETDPQTGVWIPKRYTGTYGTNGFRLSFANNSSTTALGYDSSGQNNNWTANNFSVTPGANNDVFVDVPSLYGTDTGLGGEVLGNYATLNPILPAFSGIITLSNGALDASTTTGTTTGQSTYATFAVSSGKWYWEATFSQSGSSSFEAHIGWATAATDNANAAYGYLRGGQKVTLGTAATYGSAYVTGDVIGVALDLDAGTMTFYKNGISQGTAFTGLTGTLIPTVRLIREASYTTAWYTNFGQRPFNYTAPSGFKALCTTNLPAPAIGQTAANQADNHFAAVTYTGNNGTQTISTLGFQPDFVWIKNRTGANSHILVDSIRGAGKGLSSESTAIEYNIPTDFQSFNSNGFTVGYGGTNITNASANNYVAWCWNAGGVSVTNSAGTNGASVASTYRANRAAGFSIVSWTYNGAATIAHGLNAVPKFMIIRGKNAVYNWDVYHASIGPTVRLVLNSTSGSQTYSGPFNNTTPTSSVFSQGAAWYNNGDSLIGYIFAEIPGYSAFGSYTGNGSADGPFIYTGFKPALILGKRTDTSSTQGWFIFDTARNIANQVDLYLSPSSANNEGTFTLGDMLSNGFKIRNTIVDWNSSGLPYIYAAFAETPARLSTAR